MFPSFVLALIPSVNVANGKRLEENAREELPIPPSGLFSDCL